MTVAQRADTLADLCVIDRQIVEPGTPESARRPYLGLEHVESHTGRIQLHATPNNGDGEASTTFAFDSRHVLYGKLRPYLNKVAVPDFVGRCTTEMIPFLPCKGVDRNYLAWFLRSPQVVASASHGTTGSRMPRADVDRLMQLRVPHRDLDEQRRIAAELTAAMAAVDRARAAAQERLAAAEAMRAACLRAAFRRVVPLWAEPREPDIASPPSWQWRMLTDLATLESGHTPSRRHPEWWNGDIPWLALADIRAADGAVITDTAEHTNSEGLANSSARLLPQGTVAMSRTASIGFVTIFGRPMCTSQDFVCWVCGDRLHNRFLLYLLLAARPYLHRLAAGAVHKTIYMPTIRSFRVCTPEPDEQLCIVRQLDEQCARAESLRTAAAAELQEIEAMPAALLSAAFSGEA